VIASRRKCRLGDLARASLRGGSWQLLALGLAALLFAACRTPAALPMGSPIEPLPGRATLVPESADYAAAELAASALASRRSHASVVMLRLESIDSVRAEAESRATGLVPYAQDLVNTLHDDALFYRRATRELLAEPELDPAFRARLEQSASDDPLTLADQRLRDARLYKTGRAFNTMIAPLSRAITSAFGALFGVARGTLGLLIAQREADELSLPERQALAHWKRFLEEHPDTPEAAEIVERVEASQARWNRTQADRALRSARRALDAGHLRIALIQSERTLRYAPEDAEAGALRERAATQLAHERERQRRSLQSPAVEVTIASERERALILALLVQPEAIAKEAEKSIAAESDGATADEARFALAIAHADANAESTMWTALQEISRGDLVKSNMARHARTSIESPEQNPYRAFQLTRRHDRRQRWLWLFFGPLLAGPRDYATLPRWAEWALGLPAFLEAFATMPNRLVTYPWLKPWPFGRAPAAYAEHYLERFPSGPHVQELRQWLLAHAERSGNWVAALEHARALEPSESVTVRDLREKAANQILEVAQRETRRDVRRHMLRELVQEYSDTQVAKSAGEQLRAQREAETPQHIRISRGFLRENPEVAGPAGLALTPGLLDGNPRNGELHPNGIVLLGGPYLEFNFLNPSGDASDEPETQRRRVSQERLARLISLLEETSLRNSLIDSDNPYALDARREAFFEHARLGLADRPDPRATSTSHFAFEGMRERYGLVRSRESVLPVDLVVQGSLSTLSLGAFPRVRMPKPTPDAVLFE